MLIIVPKKKTLSLSIRYLETHIPPQLPHLRLIPFYKYLPLKKVAAALHKEEKYCLGDIMYSDILHAFRMPDNSVVVHPDGFIEIARELGAAWAKSLIKITRHEIRVFLNMRAEALKRAKALQNHAQTKNHLE